VITAFDPKLTLRATLYSITIVGDGKQRTWHSEGKRLRGFEVDQQLDTADRQEPTEALATKIGGSKRSSPSSQRRCGASMGSRRECWLRPIRIVSFS